MVTPAIAGKMNIIRGQHHLFGIGERLDLSVSFVLSRNFVDRALETSVIRSTNSH